MFLTNYPYGKEVTDEQEIYFLALRMCTYRHRSATLPYCDYGIPYDPAQLLAERNRTNPVKRPPVDSTNSPSITNRTEQKEPKKN